MAIGACTRSCARTSSRARICPAAGLRPLDPSAEQGHRFQAGQRYVAYNDRNARFSPARLWWTLNVITGDRDVRSPFHSVFDRFDFLQSAMDQGLRADSIGPYINGENGAPRVRRAPPSRRARLRVRAASRVAPCVRNPRSPRSGRAAGLPPCARSLRAYAADPGGRRSRWRGT
jgi:hypothetical protein